MNRLIIFALGLLIATTLAVVADAESQTLVGSVGAKGQFEAGMRYYDAAKPDFAKAFPLIRQAARAGDAGAQAQVGYMYEMGLGIPKNADKAIAWATKSADRNNSSGQNVLGQIYVKSPDMPNHYIKALTLYKLSAAQGNSTGEASLGWMYVHGYGVKTNYKKALFWFRKSIEHNGADGANDLSVSYFFGQGLPRSNVKALKWLYVAKALPSTELAAKIERNIANLEARMSSDEIRKARRFANAWLKLHDTTSSGGKND